MPGGKPEVERPPVANNAKSNTNNRNADMKELKKEPATPQHHQQQHHGGGGGGGGGGMKRPYSKRGGGGGGGQGFHGGYGQGGGGGGEFSNYNRQRMQGNHNLSIPGPTTNLETKPLEIKKFTGRCRLFVGNLTPDIEEKEFRGMFEPFGELAEVFLNAQKGFGFVKMDTRANAETAKLQLDGTQRKGRVLRVRFATHGAALKVKNLAPWVSNELLELSFSLFGELERAVVIVDERGKPTGDGIVEFARKPGAQMALKRCNDGAFLLTSSPRPVIVEPLEQKDDEDGYPEKVLPRNSNQYLKERDIGPRFALPGTFEYEFSQKWKQLFELEKQKRENLEKDIASDRERLEDSMEFALYEHETNILREKLRQREQDANNLLREREMRRRECLREDEGRHEMMRQDDFMRNDDMRRRQEDSLLMQANHLSSLLDQQEAAIRQMSGGGSGGGGGAGGGGNNTPGGRGGPAGPMGAGAGGPAGPVMGGGGGMGNSGGGGGNMGNQTGPAGPGGINSGQQPRQSRFEQSAGPPPPMMGQGGPNGPMNRGGMGPMGPQMGGPMGDMRGGGGGGMGRRDLMERRDHRDDFADAKRRRF